MNQMKKRKPYQQPQIRVVEVSEAVAMLNANSGNGNIGDLNDGGDLGDNTQTSGNGGTIGDLDWEDLGGNVSGGAKAGSVFESETSHKNVWDY